LAAKWSALEAAWAGVRAGVTAPFQWPTRGPAALQPTGHWASTDAAIAQRAAMVFMIRDSCLIVMPS